MWGFGRKGMRKKRRGSMVMKLFRTKMQIDLGYVTSNEFKWNK